MRRASACLTLALICSCRTEPSPEAAIAPHDSPSGTRKALLRPGEPAPEFSALSQTGYMVTLGQFLQKPVALYFCPTGLDASCTSLMAALRDHWLSLNQKLGMLLFVVPSDYAENRAASRRHELPFLVLADPGGAVLARYGVTGERPVGFLVGPDQKTLRVFAEPTGPEHAIALGRELP